MKKILLITNIPNPYRIPLFNELSAQLTTEGYELLVVFGAKTYSRRKFELSESDMHFRFTYLHSEAIQLGSDNEKTTFSYRGLSKLIRKERPSLVITNGFSPASTMVFLNRLTGGPPYLIWSGAIEAPGRNDSLLRKLQRGMLARFASGFVVYGSRAAEYLKSVGIGNKPVSVAINTVDTRFFSEQTELERLNYSPDGLIHLTYIGYLVKRKGVDKLLDCIRMLSKDRSGFVLDILGDGEDRQRLEDYCRQQGISHLVRFHGFIQKATLPSYLSKSRIFLFQTDFDIWGLVLNEAMAAGMAVVASPNAGASYDLIREGITGYLSDFRDTATTTDRIRYLLDHPAEAAQTGQQAAAFIRENASLQVSASGFADAIRKAGI